jgi:tRNA pseudouridine55 synthase
MDGVLVVDKPAGPTSHDIVGLVRRLAATPRVGHGGTLDPFASGVLPIFLGRATRLTEYHLGERKAYRATVCFGASSTTDDLEGELAVHPGPAPTRAAVEAGLTAFRGALDQVPPAYSAVQVEVGALARAGKPPTLRAGQSSSGGWSWSVGCHGHRSADRRARGRVLGRTYVRAIARDLRRRWAAPYLGA